MKQNFFQMCINTANPKALEAALKIYGKTLITSVYKEKKALETILPLAKEFDVTAIGLCMGDDGIPTSPDERITVAEKSLNSQHNMASALKIL
jgi:5-methyltetrahydrofolate--homocysteine methyltransferase